MVNVSNYLRWSFKLNFLVTFSFLRKHYIDFDLNLIFLKEPYIVIYLSKITLINFLKLNSFHSFYFLESTILIIFNSITS